MYNRYLHLLSDGSACVCSMPVLEKECRTGDVGLSADAQAVLLTVTSE